ncbi:hypothetical protein N8524_01320 [Candidatus Puniceispirillum sp.]|nr:hypothetical protein [Candidatus Puniceispirillum sp.]
MNLFSHKKASALTRGFVSALMMLMLIGGQFLIGQPVKAETQQHRWAGDVPIMQGWQIEPELGFAFDSPNGRIVMIFASTAADENDIMAFYGQTLAQLGWTGGAGNWVRDAEKLVIGKVQTARGALWRLMLQPR